MTVPYSFGTATSAIPLSQLDSNFNTPITLGNTAIQLGNTVTTLNNMTLANVTISSGNVTITNVSVTTANVTTVNATTIIATTANVTTGNVTNLISGNVALTGGAINGTTLGATTAASANVTTLTTSSTVTLNGGTANGVAYLNASKVLTTGTALVFDGTNLGLSVTPSAWNSSAKAFQYSTTGSVWAVAGQSRIGNNHYYDAGGTFRYLTSSAIATDFSQTSSGFSWSIAPSGTAGNAISFTQAMTLDSAGRLLLATTSAGGETLQIGGTTTAQTYALGLRNNGATNIEMYYAGAGLTTWHTGVNTSNQFYIGQDSNAYKVIVDSSGNLLVGMTTYSTATNGIAISAVGTETTNTPRLSISGADSTNTYTAFSIYSTGAAANRFYVGYGGTVYATNTTITAISDQRLKENIRDLDDGLVAVMALKPRKFDWKAGKGKDKKGDRGWIAQELEQVFPDMVTTWLDPAPEGEEPYKAVNADLIPVLVKALQELKAEVDSLKAQLKGA